MKPDFLRRSFLFFIILAAASPLGAQNQEVFPVRDSEWSQSLSGAWKFKYIAGSSAESDGDFFQPGFDAGVWKDIPVPSHWELHGFAPPKYGHVDKGLGLYRTNFRVPESWKGRRIFLRFEGVLYGFDAWVNGKKVGTWASSYNPCTFDITDALNPAADNVLAVEVTTHCKGFEFDENDCWAISGIYREPFLFSTPQTYFKDYTARTTLAADGSAKLQIDSREGGITNPPGTTVTGRLLSRTDEVLAEWETPLTVDEVGNAEGESIIKIDHPKLWTAETPILYGIELTIKTGGQTAQVIRDRIGIRQITIENGLLKLNGTPIKLHGIDHHDIWPIEGRTATDELLLKDLKLIREANINFIRTSHYPPDRRFIEHCDELGIYVMCEVPFGYGDEHLTDPSYQDILLTRARATLLRDKNRPSIIVWSVGNENPITPIQLETGREVKRLDPTRPICYPTSGSYFATHYQQFPEFVDIYAPHYPVISRLKEYATKFTRPIILSEYAHQLGLAADRVQDEWEVIYNSPRVAGGAIWMFQDQGLFTETNTPMDLDTPSKYVWKDPQHYYDTHETAGVDGIVYSDRTPEVDYWEVRKVYSPVQISGSSVKVRPGTRKITLPIENRFDFRDLTGINLNWTLCRNGHALQSGVQPLSAKAHQHETVTVKLKLPDDLTENIYTLEAKCIDEAGHQFYERVISLEPEKEVNRAAQFVAALPTATGLKVETQGNISRVINDRFEVTLARDTGAIEIHGRDGRLIAQGLYPHVGRRFTMGEEIRTKTVSIWRGNYLRNPEELSAEVTQEKGGARVRVHGKYRRADAPDQFIVGEHSLFVTDHGTIEVSYDYQPLQAKGTFLELGLSLIVPASDSEFHWLGQGPYAGYPGKDRMNEFGAYHLNSQDIRFQGNHRQVEAAMLTTSSGNGVGVAAPAMEIAVENTKDGIVLSHNALVSGRGNKGSEPETSIYANAVNKFSGKFTLTVLDAAWPKLVTDWFGAPGTVAELQHPYYRSYDQ